MKTDFLKWIEHAGFLIEFNDQHIYIDPYRGRYEMPKADLIFITHSHFDHFNEEQLKKITATKTIFVVPKEMAGSLHGKNVISVEPNKRYEVGGIEFSTVPSYNTNKEFHPRSRGWVGYIMDIGGTRIYHAGDTDLTEEMRKIETDVALLPMGGHYTMDLQEAIIATERIRAETFVPMHYKALLGEEGSKVAEQEFKKKVKGGALLKQIQDAYYSFQ